MICPDADIRNADWPKRTNDHFPQDEPASPVDRDDTSPAAARSASPAGLEVILRPDHPRYAAIARALRYAAFDPSEPRDKGGRWTKPTQGELMRNHYGYIRRAISEADGDHIDVFLGPDPESEVVFVIDQVDVDGYFDEHKTMLGWTSAADARDAYLANYSPGWRGFDGITAMTMEEFKTWMADGDTSRGAMIGKYQRFVRARILRYAFDPSEPRDAAGAG